MSAGGASEIAAHLAELHERIAAAARAAGRAPESVTLVAVSKAVEAGAVTAAVAAGQHAFGENRAQELAKKAALLASASTAGPIAETIEWHFIGQLQRNKVKSVAAHVGLWHSIDRAEVGLAVARYAPGARVLVQVNVSGEERKGGCRPEDAPALVDALVEAGLAVEGLMTVPPMTGDPRPHFAALRELGAGFGLPTLSMGMSGDFEAAIAEGSTIVRVGRAVFGSRP